MNLQSEIDYFNELAPLDQARMLSVFIHELSAEGRVTYGPSVDQVLDGARLRFVNEMVCRLARYVEQLLGDDPTRPGADVLMRMLLTPRADKSAERMIQNSYRRAIQGFDRYDTTVTF